MADGEDIQPLVCDNGTGMVKVHLYMTFVDINLITFSFIIFGYNAVLSGSFICVSNSLGWICWR